MKTLTIYDDKLEKELLVTYGENAQDNWDILDKSNPQDIWFHLEGHPSSHIILSLPEEKKSKLNKLKINKKTIYFCASLCKSKSKFSNYSKISVIYTQCQYVKKGTIPGQVLANRVTKIVV